MSKPKIIIAALILGLGLAGAYFIVLNNNSSKPIKENTLAETIGNNPVGIEPISASSAQNITNLLTQKIAESITDQNKEGFITSNGKTFISAPEPQKMVSELLTEAQKNFDPNSLKPQIKDSSLKISEDVGKEALVKYFNSFSDIITNSAKDVPASFTSSEDIKISDFTQIVNTYTKTINSFYSLSAPRSILDIHKKELELLTTEKNIYEKMANAEQDPMTAFLASNELLKIEGEFGILEVRITDFIKKYVLK